MADAGLPQVLINPGDRSHPVHLARRLADGRRAVAVKSAERLRTALDAIAREVILVDRRPLLGDLYSRALRESPPSDLARRPDRRPADEVARIGMGQSLRRAIHFSK
jgi:hypothetical protein